MTSSRRSPRTNTTGSRRQHGVTTRDTAESTVPRAVAEQAGGHPEPACHSGPSLDRAPNVGVPEALRARLPATAVLGAVSPWQLRWRLFRQLLQRACPGPHPAATEVTVSQERLPREGSSSPGQALQPLLTDRDVAAVLAVRPDTVRRWAARGSLPSVRLGGRLLRFRAEDVQQWIQGQTSPGHLAPSVRRKSGSIRSTS